MIFFYFTYFSPKWNNAIIEMALKSFILSNVDHQKSKSWKQIAAHAYETITKFDRLKNWLLDCSAKDRISSKTF